MKFIEFAKQHGYDLDNPMQNLAGIESIRQLWLVSAQEQIIR